MGRPKGSKNKRINPNPYRIVGGLCEIHLTGSKGARRGIALIDFSDRGLLDRRWSMLGNGYAVTTLDRKTKYLHHFILSKKKGMDVDHISGNPLDNRRKNLRYLSHRVNLYNNKASGVKKTKYGKYQAFIGANRSIYLGSFESFEEAKEARNDAIIKMFNITPYGR